MKILLCCLSLSCTLLSLRTVQAQDTRIAAAADLKFALDDLRRQYEQEFGKKTAVTYGSSGNFFAQLQHGAPFDLFLSADIEYPRKLEAAGQVEPGTLYEYAVGRIVIWMPKETPIDLKNLGWNALLDPRVQKIAIANPAHAPYGRAAVAAIRKAGVYDQLHTKFVYGENIGQAAQFVASRNAQAAILALSLALAPPMRDGQRWDIPPGMHPAIRQAAVVLKSASNKDGALAFLAFLKRASSQKVLGLYGFALPPTATRKAEK